MRQSICRRHPTLTRTRLAIELATSIRQAIRPLLGLRSSRLIAGTAASGDATFAIDEVAELATFEFIKTHGLNAGCYTEDAGLQTFGTPESLVVVDPIDGTRGAAAGFECCVVSVAVASYDPDVRLRDVEVGCVYEIIHDRMFVAERGSGARIIESGVESPVRLYAPEKIENASWTAELVGRPVGLVGQVLGEAIDLSAVRGGFFVINSSAYSLTRLVTGQLSAAVDVGARVALEVPGAREEFLKAGSGIVLGIFPYDIAAAAPIAREAGCVVTDAWGRPLDDIRLLDSSQNNVLTLLAATSEALHEQFLASVERGIARFSYSA